MLEGERMAVYRLPDLPYDYAALEPHYSAQVLELHHSKHHAAYVKGANDTLDALASARAAGDFATINLLEKNLAFHVSGHVLHSIFWTNMTPGAAERPDGALASDIDTHFGSFEAFRAQLTAATLGVQGSGWGVLAWEPLGGRLIVEQVYDHQSNLAHGSVPILVIDSWEHAFYLQYKNVKADFVTAFWKIVDWADVDRRLRTAQQAGSLLG
jgi:Fe-Mn family superoxide dismutase